MSARKVLTLQLRSEQDVVTIRQRTKEVAALLGLENQDRVRLATAVSEIVRNAYMYGGGGRVEFEILDETLFVIRVQDTGKGISNLHEIYSGQYVSKTGMGLGIIGAKRIVDGLRIETSSNKGTLVILEKKLPIAIGAHAIKKLVEVLARTAPKDPLSELHTQNQELIQAMTELEENQTRLNDLNRELTQTNQGVVALYAELDERAASLKRASEAKTSFLSDLTHEFRSPLYSILNLTTLLLSESDNEFGPSEVKEVSFIQNSAKDLLKLVNELLDLAKVEAGKVVVRPTTFALSELFGSLRGVLKPLLDSNQQVVLTFKEPELGLAMNTDQTKLSQILRNLISNAIKFTEQGEIVVLVKEIESDFVEFSIRDSGIGIAPENQETIFHEFVQINSRLQEKHIGTGLGLPLARKLVHILGGRLAVKSAMGEGTTFTFILPLYYRGANVVDYISTDLDPLKTQEFVTANTVKELGPVLVIDDDESSLYHTCQLLDELHVPSLKTTNGEEGYRLATRLNPRLIILDLMMPNWDGYRVLKELRANPLTADVPVVIHSSKELDEHETSFFDAATLGYLQKTAVTKEAKLNMLREFLSRTKGARGEIDYESTN